MSQWQIELKDLITNYAELFKLINLNPAQCNLDLNKLNLSTKFPLLVTKSWIARIEPNNPSDPLLLQILPNINKLNNLASTYSCNPLQEQTFNNIPGLIHKYNGRVLILVTGACAIHCQYCFRQNFLYRSNIANSKNLPNIIKYLAQNAEIGEVILSGGDPLLAPNNYFANLLKLLDPILHIQTIRIHSRIPIVLPSRLELDLIKILQNSRFKCVIVSHCNHPNELNQEVANYYKNLENTKITLLNQAVLLKNINDHPKVLMELSKKLFSLNILPYYLHLLDRVTGAEHFEVELNHAKELIAILANNLPGYLVPRLVTEIPGYGCKTLIISDQNKIK